MQSGSGVVCPLGVIGGMWSTLTVEDCSCGRAAVGGVAVGGVAAVMVQRRGASADVAETWSMRFSWAGCSTTGTHFIARWLEARLVRWLVPTLE